MKKRKYDSCCGSKSTLSAGGDCNDTINSATGEASTGNGTGEGDFHAQIHEVVTNDLLLRYIFKHVDLDGLKSCRKVNRLWNSEATKILRQNYLTKAIILSNSNWTSRKLERARWEASFGIGCCGFTTMMGGKHKKGTFRQMVNVVEKSISKTFPCNQFKVTSIQILEVGSFQKLMTLHGEHIRSLDLSLDSVKPNQLKLLETLLGNQLPNLEYLSLREMEKKWGTTFQIFSESTEQFVMTRLKTLDMSSCQGRLPKSLLTNLLKLAVNVETLHCNWEKYNEKNVETNLALLLELNVMHLVKNFKFDFHPSRFQSYRKFADKSQKLEKIKSIILDDSIDRESLKEVGDILSKCLISNADSLKSIKECCFPFGLLSGWQLPHLPKLTKFEYGEEMSDWHWKHSLCERPSSIPIFPPGSILSDQWPNLTTVTIWFDYEILNSYNITEVFSADLIPHNSVRKFSASIHHDKGIPTEWVEHFCKLFPHVTEAYFRPLKDFRSACQHIWKLENLEDLDFSLSFDNQQIQVFPSVEAGFTGFTEETCKKLLENPEESLKLSKEDAKKLRVNPSIVDLKYLKSLKVRVESWFWDWNSEAKQKDREVADNDSDGLLAEEQGEEPMNEEANEEGEGDVQNQEAIEQGNQPAIANEDQQAIANENQQAIANEVQQAIANEDQQAIANEDQQAIENEDQQQSSDEDEQESSDEDEQQSGDEEESSSAEDQHASSDDDDDVAAEDEDESNSLVKETADSGSQDANDEGGNTGKKRRRAGSEGDDDDDDDDENDDGDNDNDKAISHVTKLLAFRMCPRLVPEDIEFEVSFNETESCCVDMYIKI